MEYKIDELIIKYLSGTLTEDEQVVLDEWKALPENRLLFDQLSDEQWVKNELQKIDQVKEINAYRKLSQIYAQQAVPITVHKTRNNRSWYWIAATLLLLIGAGLWFVLTRKTGEVPPNNIITTDERFKNDVQPGGNKAVLTLADGTHIILDSATNGLLMQQGNTNITKLDNGEIAYKSGPGNGEPGMIAYNTITTPRGGQYMITLPDGSKAWLNSASSLRFPTAFIGMERIVELTGEGYFEVNPALSSGGETKKKPFIVKTGDIQIQVLGTHFNINAYTDEEVIKTTLLEGAVKVVSGDRSGLLRPGQQAQVDKQGTLRTAPQVDLEQTMAWHKEVFAFRNASIVSVMRQAQRWYDIEVAYEGKVNREQLLNGDIPRNVALSQLLKILEGTGLAHFRIEGKTVTVMP